MESCISTAAATRRAASAAHPDFALKSDPIRFVGEARLPLGQVHGEVLPHLLSHAFPAFECFAWHENTMAFSGAWSAAGFSAASLADRPASSPPPPQSIHFISEDVPFFEWWPHPITMLTTHWDCAPMARCLQDAARFRHHADGTLAAVVEHAVWCQHVSVLHACEQPPSHLEDVIGAPSVKTNVSNFGSSRVKHWWWWQSPELPIVAPTILPDLAALRSTHHDHDHLPIELRKLARAVTPASFAVAHVSAWSDAVRAATASSRQPGHPTAPFSSALASARVSFTMWLAGRRELVPMVPHIPLAAPAAHVHVDRCIVVPVARADDGRFFALCLDEEFFGVACQRADAATAADSLARRLACAVAPTHTSNVVNSLAGLDVVYALAAPPMPSPPTHGPASWLPVDEIPPSYGSYAISQCLRRMAQRASEGPPPDVVLGARGPPVPLLRSVDGAAWAAAPVADDASEQWLSFLRSDHAQCLSLQQAMRRADCGDGRLCRWAQQVRSALDESADIPVPVQGRVTLHPSLRWALLPESFVPAPLP